jgi:hypothetical protein
VIVKDSDVDLGPFFPRQRNRFDKLIIAAGHRLAK